jgi:hypothetical protein
LKCRTTVWSAIPSAADIGIIPSKKVTFIIFSFEEALFIQLTLGDDRAVQATYVAGELVYSRSEEKQLVAV